MSTTPEEFEALKAGDFVEHEGSPGVVWEIVEVLLANSSTPWSRVRLFDKRQREEAWCRQVSTGFWHKELYSTSPLLVLALAAE